MHARTLGRGHAFMTLGLGHAFILSLGLGLALLSLSPSALADGAAAEIRQLSAGRGLAGVKLINRALAPGATLLATSADGRQCSLSLRSAKGASGVVDTSGCVFARDLRVGQRLELSLLESDELAPAANRAPQANVEGPASSPSAAPSRSAGSSSAHRRSGFDWGEAELQGLSVFGYYDLADKVSGDLSAGSKSTGVSIGSEASAGVGLSYAQARARALGFYGEVGYEFGRDLKNATVTGRTSDINPRPTLSLFAGSVGGTFGFSETVYAMAGINYSLPRLTGGGDLTSIDGRLGFQGGIGARVLPQLEIQGIYRQLGLKAAGSGFNMDDLTMNGVMLRAGYLF